MQETDKDLFDKIEALLEKRGPDALLDKPMEDEDFPVLTEVIQAAGVGPVAAVPAAVREVPVAVVQERRQAERRLQDRREMERRLRDRRQDHLAADALLQTLTAGDELERLARVLELRMADLFIRQQVRMEEVIRKAVRAELDKGAKE
ncbi:MAG TPA: hypothetical protein PKH69_09095 [Thiobacillaceae bacterium]|nr:hypothetical protein [Thiobacillaceae bacterium]HNU64411.1 hypothetical protein [Thiobacillaceae bacterium]